MSGGHWNYLQFRLEERAKHADIWLLMAAIEKALDYGICCDSCYECEKIRVIEALELYFDNEAESAEESISHLMGHDDKCQRCKERKREQEHTQN